MQVNLEEISSLSDGYEINLTWECNWNCKYCIVDTHKRPRKKFEDLIQELENLPNGTSVTLGGGEPGMLSRDEITKVINLLNSKNIIMDLLTNGLFLKKYPHLLHNFKEVLYHCVEDMREDKEIEFPNFLDTSFDLYYVLVIAREEDYKNILKYFKAYPDIKFVVNANTKKSEALGIGRFLKFIKKYENHINIKKTELGIFINT